MLKKIVLVSLMAVLASGCSTLFGPSAYEKAVAAEQARNDHRYNVCMDEYKLRVKSGFEVQGSWEDIIAYCEDKAKRKKAPTQIGASK